MWLDLDKRLQKRDFALNVAAINLGFAGQQKQIDAALRKFDE